MTAAKLLLALGGSHVLALSGTGPASSVIYRDQPDNTCTIDQACSPTALVPTLRGLCVNTPTGKSCWDACNTAHGPTDFSNTSPEVKAGIALMVKQLRTGMRTGSCPGMAETPTCDPGQRCTPMGLTLGRGMCVTITGQGNQCLDMCDPAIPLTTFHDMPGKQAGTVTTVQQVRAGVDPQGRTTCPTPSVWLWLWVPIFMLCGVVGCGAAYYQKSKIKRSQPKGYREPEPFLEDQMEPYADYGQGMPQPQEFQQAEEMPVIDQPQLTVAQPQEKSFEPQPTYPPIATQTMAPAPAITMPPQGYTTTGQPMASYPQAGSMMVGGSTMASRPAYQAPMGGSMASQMPAYGAYGGYAGQPLGTTYPTGSMRIQQ